MDGLYNYDYVTYDLDDFSDHVRYYQDNGADLQAIQHMGTDFVRPRFSRPAIVEYLYRRIAQIHSGEYGAGQGGL